MNLFEKGWICPRCEAVMSPTTSCCINCRGSKNLLDDAGFIGITPDIIRLKKAIQEAEENTQKIIDTWNNNSKSEKEKKDDKQQSIPRPTPIWQN